MTTIFTTILETLSDTVLLLAIINTVNTLCKNITDSSVQNKKRLIITIGISCILSIAFNQNFFRQHRTLRFENAAKFNSTSIL